MPWTDPSLLDPLIELVSKNVWLLVLIGALEAAFWFFIGYKVVASRWFRDAVSKLRAAAAKAKKARGGHGRIP